MKYLKKFSNLDGWIVIFFCAAFLFYKYILQVSPSVMTASLMQAFHVDGLGLGNLAATYFYAYLVTQFLIGPLFDFYSPKYLTVFAITICAIGAFLFSMAHALIIAIFARALMGFGTAFATIAYMKMSSQWFRQDEVPFVDGLLATAAMAGALSGQVPLRLIVNETGWRGGLMVVGIFGIALAFLYLLFVKQKKTNTGEATQSPADLFRGLLTLLKSKKNWILAFYSGLAFTPVAVLGGLWGNPFFQVSHHLTPAEAAYYSSFMFVGLAVGAPVFGFLTKIFHHKLKTMILGTAIGFVALVVSLYVNLPLWAFAVALFIFGFGTGSFMSCFSVGKEMNPIRFAACVVALINSGDALFGSFTEPFIGKMLDWGWTGKVVNGVHFFGLHDYRVALSLLPLYSFGALICLFLLPKDELRAHRSETPAPLL